MMDEDTKEPIEEIREEDGQSSEVGSMLQMKAGNFRFQEPRQERLFEKLRQIVGEGPALMYRDACWLMECGLGLASTTCLVAHLLREINGAIIDLMLPVGWKPEACPECEQNKKGAYQAKINAILGMQGYTWTDAEQMEGLWMSLRGLHKFAHKNSLCAPRPLGEDLERDFKRAELAFRIAVSTLEASFPAVMAKLDQLLSIKKPKEEDATTLQTQIPNSPVIMKQFFDRAGSEWLKPLRKKHFFEDPPGAVYDEEHGWVQPPWPQSAYLRRMAATEDAAPLVCEIIKSMPHVDNGLINNDLGEAMLAMPPKVAVSLVKEAAKWLEAEALFNLPETLGQVVAKLAAGGEAEGAVELAQALLAVPIVREDGADRRLSSRLDDYYYYYYREILEKHVPILVRYAGMPALEMLCDLLDRVLRSSYPEHAVEGDFEDMSNSWHDEIDEDDRFSSPDLKQLLTVAVRRTAEQMLLENGEKVAELVDVLESRKWPVFRRIALRVLRLSPEPAMDLVSARLADRDLFSDPCILDMGIAREYGLLLERWYPILPDAQKSEILNWIKQGPDLRMRYTDNSDEPPVEATLVGCAERWRLRRLSLIKDHLTGHWLRLYKSLDRKYASDRTDDTSTARWGRPRPQLNAERMSAMDVHDLMDQLEAWTPTGPFEERDGVAHELTTSVATDPKRFSEAAEEFCRLRPLYVWALLHGLREAVKEGKQIRWKPVLKLCERFLAQRPPDMAPDREEADRDWVWTCRAIAELVRSGLTAERRRLPLALRREVWDSIELLASEPDPPSKDSGQGEPSVDDRWFAALTQVRAQAVRAAIDYGIWLKSKRKSKDVEVQLEAMPEVQKLLERHLNPQHEQSVVVHSVYGLRLHRLLWLDGKWTAEHIDEIFPTEPQSHDLFEAAWVLYTVGTTFDGSAFPILESKYRHAVSTMTVGEGERWYSNNPNAALVTHILRLYGTGKIDLDGESSLVAQVFAKMPDKWRGRAIAFIGDTIARTPEVLSRLQRLWEWRWSKIEQAQLPRAHYHELSSFGWWWVSEKFPSDWALKQLESVLGAVHWAEPDDNVVAKLAELASKNPGQAVRLLSKMCEELQVKYRYHYITWTRDAREIISAALGSNDGEAQQCARKLVSRLQFQGYNGFEDLTR